VRYLYTPHCISSYDKFFEVRVAEMAVIRINMDLGISYGLEIRGTIRPEKETYAQVTGRNDDQMQKEQEEELDRET
jgi:hypothetical protein